MKLLIVHEVNYLEKIIYEFQILPEILSTFGHDITIIDYDDSWALLDRTVGAVYDRPCLKTRVYEDVHRAYPEAAVTVRRPGMIRIPGLSRVSAAITAGLEVNRLLSSHKIDAVILYGLPTVGLQTLIAARRFGVPIVFRSIDVLPQLVPFRSLAALTRIMERYIYPRVDAVFPITLNLKEHIVSCGVPESRIRLLPSGVDTRMFSPGCRNVKLLQKWGIRAQDPVILFMGTIYKFSGLDRVITDFARLVSRYPNVKLLIVGCGEDEERLKNLSAETGMSNHVVFGGLHPYSALVDIIRSSDVCINPFELNDITRDILPTKLFQYLACGKPVVATELPGTIPFLTGEDHGVVYSALDGFVDCIGDLLANTTRREELGRRGVDITRKNYEWTRIAETMVSWIQEIRESVSHHE
jgi:glycosyltransferase involved in cell wall biosynthesis